MKSNLQEHRKELEGLNNKMSRASDFLKREKNSRREIMAVDEDIEQMKRNIEKLKKKQI